MPDAIIQAAELRRLAREDPCNELADMMLAAAEEIERLNAQVEQKERVADEIAERSVRLDAQVQALHADYVTANEGLLAAHRRAQELQAELDRWKPKKTILP